MTQNQDSVGSSPTRSTRLCRCGLMDKATVFYTVGWEFESLQRRQVYVCVSELVRKRIANPYHEGSSPFSRTINDDWGD